MKITSFSGAFEFLSNFYQHPVVYNGVEYPTVEHGFAAQKTLDPRQRGEILCAATPGMAKRLGRRATLRADWNQIRDGVMETLLRNKFKKNTPLARMLVKTGDRELIEGNNWGDRYWGAVWDSSAQQWFGANMLGRLLMKIRGELQAQVVLEEYDISHELTD